MVISAVMKDKAQPLMKKILTMASNVLDEDFDDGEGEKPNDGTAPGEHKDEMITMQESNRYTMATSSDEGSQDMTAVEPFSTQNTMSPTYTQ